MDDASHERRQRMTGIALMCGAVASFALLDTTAKYPQSAHGHAAGGVGPLHRGISVSVHRFESVDAAGLDAHRAAGLQLCRSLLLLGSTICNFFALRYLQLDEALAILFSTPFLVAVLAGPMLGEWVGWRRWTAIWSALPACWW